MPDRLSRAAMIMRELMASKFSKKMICLKVDAATRQSKSFFAINMSITEDNDNIQIFHLGEC